MLEPKRLKLPDSVVKAAARVAQKSPYEIIARAPQPTVSIRFQCTAAELSTLQATAFPEVIGCVTAAGAKMAAPWSEVAGRAAAAAAARQKLRNRETHSALAGRSMPRWFSPRIGRMKPLLRARSDGVEIHDRAHTDSRSSS
jgi:hypothetical protein